MRIRIGTDRLCIPPDEGDVFQIVGKDEEDYHLKIIDFRNTLDRIHSIRARGYWVYPIYGNCELIHISEIEVIGRL